MSEILISATQLQAMLHEPDVVVFDVRHDLMNHRLGRQQYMQAHIPGAYFLDNEAELVGAKTGQNGRHPLPNLEALAHLMLQYQVTPQTRVVVYDDSQGHMAARTWWLLRWAGVSQVMLLDGGWQAWLEAGGLIDSHIALPPVLEKHHKMTVVPQQATVTAEQILEHLTQARFTLIDARAAERYRGEKEPIDAVAGHVPGALNRPTTANLQAGGTFKPAEQLRVEFQELLGDTAIDSVVCYCGSGITACHNLFALELAGLSGAKLYPGSWSEWIADPSRPRVP